MNIGGLIRKELKRRKMKQVRFAEKIKLSNTATNQILNDVYFPSRSTLKKIEEVLQLEFHIIAVRTVEKRNYPKKK